VAHGLLRRDAARKNFPHGGAVSFSKIDKAMQPPRTAGLLETGIVPAPKIS